MISAFNTLVSYEEDAWAEFLDRVLLIEIFKPVIEYYKEADTIKCVVRYIAYAYSIESDKVHLGMEWKKNKEAIFEFVNIKPIRGMYEDLIELKSEAVLTCVQRWIEYQDSDTFGQLMLLKDLRLEMQRSSLTDIQKGANGGVDFDQKYKNAGYAVELRQKIKDLESELIQNSPKLKDAIFEFKNVKKKNSIGPENYSK